MVPTFHYYAFISYSHQDKAWADWLHKALETYAVPKRLVGQNTAAGIIPTRITPIFRDRDELASAHDLGRKVSEALAQSANLLVICSPRSAASHWVEEEILAYKRLGRSERVFCLIVDGEPNASDLPGRQAEECFADALRFQLDTDGQPTTQRAEPIAADARTGKDGKGNAKLKLIAGMLDVGFDDLKQRELRRRARRMTAVAALALVVMIVTSVLAIAALISRHDAVIAQQKAVIAQKAALVSQAAAERRQKQAEGLVSFMLGDLNERLTEVGRLDIMQAVDDKAMAYFEALPTSDVTDDALQQRVKALEEIGNIRMLQGHLDAALQSFGAGAKLAAHLVHKAPLESSRRIAYSRILAFMGMTRWSQGRLNAAQQEFESARLALQAPDPNSHNDLPREFQLAILDNDIGHVLEARGQPAAAEVAYRSDLALSQKLVAAQPASADYLSQLGAAHNNLGKMALMTGELATAISEYRADATLEASLSARAPRDNNQWLDTFTVQAILGRTLALTGQVNSGIRNLQQAVHTAIQVLKVDSTQTVVQENLALYRMQLSRLLRLRGQLSAATSLTALSLQEFAKLTRQDPANATWKREFAEVLTEHAAQTLARGDKVQARRQVQAALALLAPEFSAQPENHALLLATVNAQLLLASLSSSAPSARQWRVEALHAAQSTRAGAGDPRLLALQVEALLALDQTAPAATVIQTLWKDGYRDPALLAVLQRKRIRYPVNPDFSMRLGQIMPPDATSTTTK